MPDQQLPLRTLNIFLAKKGFRGPTQLLKLSEGYRSYSVSTQKGYLGVLFVRPSDPKRPDWLTLFDGALDEPIAKIPLETSSASAVLILEHEGRSYLLTFGYGRGMIQDGVTESRFGLLATLNAIDPDRIRSLDRRSFERVQRHSREQTSQDSGFSAFGLNVEQDLVRAVTGTPSQASYGERFAGHDSLAASIRCKLEGLPSLLSSYKKLADGTDYKARYPWIDNIAEVSDSALRNQLDTSLVRMIQKEELEAISLCPPDLLNWQEVEGFAYRSAKSAALTSDLEWPAYFKEVRTSREVTVQHLKSDRIACIRTDGGGPLGTWSLRNCIAAELYDNGSRYVLSEGKWYRIDEVYAARVVDAVEKIPQTTRLLPDYDHDSEEAYNEAVAGNSKGSIALMDQKLVRTETASGSIEFCDLFDNEKRLIHVKRYGASSVLSHLFAQGLVSARLVLADQAFREATNKFLPVSHRFADCSVAPDPREYEVAYAIVGVRGKPLKLPFFSMVNLKNASDLLTQIGFKVTLTRIENKR